MSVVASFIRRFFLIDLVIDIPVIAAFLLLFALACCATAGTRGGQDRTTLIPRAVAA